MTIILDFDGTLCDTRSIITSTMEVTAVELRLPVLSANRYAATIGLKLEEAFARLYNLDTEASERAAAVYRRLFALRDMIAATTLFPHVADTLAFLHRQGHTLTIASSRGHESLDTLLAAHGLRSLITLVIGGDDTTRAKPDPEPVALMLRRLGSSTADALVVGDTSFDIHMGRRAGATTCGVTYGNGTYDELKDAGAHFIIQRFDLLPTVVARLTENTGRNK